ncbi:MAG: hypothetical protein M1812_000660 [Candelaria pacifica]|nr:MAG: hypothetical protein M1812_000660 [Candelaria pacifica]
MDVLMALPRMIAERVGSVVGGVNGGSTIASATGNETMNATVIATSTRTIQSGQEAIFSTLSTPNAHKEATRVTGFFGLKHLKGYGAIWGYFQSKWALGTLVIAIILNRTFIYGSARRPISLDWPVRLALRLIPILLFLYHTKCLLEAIRCQTSPAFASLRSGNPEKSFPLDFATSGGGLYTLSSALLFWNNDRDSCAAAGMIESPKTSNPPSGSLSLLWPFFQSLCLSKFVETLSCAVQGNTPQTETSMTIFEHSLAFSEAEAMIGNHVERTQFRSSNPTTASRVHQNSNFPAATTALLQSTLRKRANSPPEVLLIALISSLNHISTNLLGILGMQERFRLINTGAWGFCYIGVFIWSVLNFASETPFQHGILSFPTACIVGFVPHILILIGICICASIYLLALLLSAISPPEGLPRARSLRERLRMARDNMQGNIQFSTMHISLREDFYTTLLRIGFAAMTAASEVVFLNEGRSVNVHQLTWLEEDRLHEIISTRQHQIRGTETELQNLQRATSDTVASGVGLLDVVQGSPNHATGRESGYAKEQKPKALKTGTRPNGPGVTGDGVGIVQRGGRWIMAMEFFKGIFWLTAGWMAIALTNTFEKFGIAWRPQWLSRLAGECLKTHNDNATPRRSQPEGLDFWLLSDDGNLSIASDDNVDVEIEMRKRLKDDTEEWGKEEEKSLDSHLYGWWSHGGWWGERDASGEYREERPDDDTTSVLSMSSAATESDWQSDDADGRRTPTQEDPYPGSRETTPFFDSTLDTSQLARLLNPVSAGEREESRILARHLASDHIVTRSGYRGLVEREKSRVLTSTRYRPGTFVTSNRAGVLSPDEEADVLEQLIITKRSFHSATSVQAGPSTADTGAEQSDLGGPQCVVCQSSSRGFFGYEQLWQMRLLQEGGVGVLKDFRALSGD